VSKSIASSSTLPSRVDGRAVKWVVQVDLLSVRRNRARSARSDALRCGAQRSAGSRCGRGYLRTGGSAEFLRADMGDASEVCALAEALLARCERIDVLIPSAGGLAPAGARTREGVDLGFAQNFLGAFLLTRL